MDAVKSFNDELSSIYETKPPVSRAKMTMLTKKAIKGIKYYKHIVQSMEKFIQKCRPEYKVPGLYVIDSVVRQSRHQFGQEKDVFMPRLCKNIISTFKHLYKCPPEEKQRIIRVLYLWQKNSVFPPEIVQQLLEMGGAPMSGHALPETALDPPKAPNELPSTSDNQTSSTPTKDQPDAGALTTMLAQLLANPNNPQIQQLTGLLSTSQQAQLQELVMQVKGQQAPKEVEPPDPPQPEPPHESSVFLPRQDNSQPPFLRSEPEVDHSSHAPPSFNRAILDYDYSDEESPKSQEINKQHHHHHHHSKPGIDMELLAKLPTVDQLKQLSGQMSNGNDFPENSATGFRKQDADDRRRRLESEQEVFDKQIQQISSELNDGGKSQDDRSSPSTSRRRRSKSRKKSRSRSRSRQRRRHRKRSRSRSRDRRRKRSRSHDRHRSHHRTSRSPDRERERDREREKRGLPPLKEGCISLCSKTLWIGNLASKISQQEIKAEVEQYGSIESINMIPPRGCAYICMEKREDAARALHKLRHTRIGGKVLKVDWAPGKEVKDEFKEFWSKDQGANYIPLDKVSGRLVALKTQGFIDIESAPEEKRAELETSVSTEQENDELEVPQAGIIPPAVGIVNPQLMPAALPAMMRPAFPFPSMNPGIGQFGVAHQRMPGFPMMPDIGGNTQPSASASAPPSLQKHEPPIGNKTPTRDEQFLDGAQRAAAVAASIMSSVRPTIHQQQMTMAQPRFSGVGQLPVQIRMVPGMPPHQPVMSAQRIGMNVMPIRMGMPMQFRPGFARVPMGQPMMSFQQPQMQRMGQMVQSMPRGPVHLPGGSFGLPGPTFPGQLPNRPQNEEEKDPEGENRNDKPRKDVVDGHQGFKRNEGPRLGMDRPPFGRPLSLDDQERAIRMGDRPLMGDRPPMGDRMPPMDGRSTMMDERPPPYGFRRSPPPGRFGYGGRRPPMDGPNGPRFPGRGRFRDQGMERDGRRRDDVGHHDRSRERSREGDCRDRDRFDVRERPGPGFGVWGRDRERFGGWDDFGHGRGHDTFGGAFGGRGRGRFEEEPDPDELEYQRKREEVLRQRRENEDQYVAEEIDLSAFGLPSGFGPPPSEDTEEQSKDGEKPERRYDGDHDGKRRDSDRDRDRDRDRRDRRRDDRDRSSRRDRDRQSTRSRDRKNNDRKEKESDKKDDGDGSPTDKKRIKLEEDGSVNKETTGGDVDKQRQTPEKQQDSVVVKDGDESVQQQSVARPSTCLDVEYKEIKIKEEHYKDKEEHSQAHSDIHDKEFEPVVESEPNFEYNQLKVQSPDHFNERYHEPKAEGIESGSESAHSVAHGEIKRLEHEHKPHEHHEYKGTSSNTMNEEMELDEQEFRCQIMNSDVKDSTVGTEADSNEKVEDQALVDVDVE